MGMREELVGELSKLDYGRAADTSRLVGMIVALAAEVFVAKAQAERLRRALARAGAVDEAALRAEGDDEAMSAWMAAEEREFARAVLSPFLRGDTSIDATSGMLER